MLVLCSLRRLPSMEGMFIKIVRRSITDLNATLKPKKKLCDLTPDELNAETQKNLSQLRVNFDNDEQNNYVVPMFKKSILYADQLAIKDTHGEYTYIQLYVSAKRLSTQLSNICCSASLKNVAYLCTNNVLSPLTQWACWISGQVAMPLNASHSAEMLQHLLKDAKADVLVVTREFEKLGLKLTEPLNITLIIIDHSFMVSSETTLLTAPRVMLSFLDKIIVEGTCSNDFYTRANAMVVYPMDTNGKPRRVVITHKNLDAQLKSLTKAWQISSKDCLLHSPPLNNAHEFISSIMCPLSVGGRVKMHDRFDTKNIWSSILGINTPAKDRVNIFMGVPAMYNSLITEYEKVLSKNNKMIGYISNYCKENIRLMVSSGAPMPPAVFRCWNEITGHNILECYGTPENGLVLSNTYIDDKNQAGGARQPGCAGLPLPNVNVRLVNVKEKILVACIGEYADDKWNVRFLDTKRLNERQQNQQDSYKYFNFALRIRSVFMNTARKLTLHILNILSHTLYLVKSFKMPSDNVKSAESAKGEEAQESTEETSPPPINIFDIENNQNKIGELQICRLEKPTENPDNIEFNGDAFDGAFSRTGDLATFQNNTFKILCRASDVIEIDCMKIPTFCIESLILEHPNIRDAKVVAVPNNDNNRNNQNTESPNESNESKTVGVVCVLQQETKLDLNSLNLFCSKSLPKRLLPTKLKIVDELPRINMIDINREAVLELFDETKMKSNGTSEQT